MQRYLRPDLLEGAGVAELGDLGRGPPRPGTVEVQYTGTLGSR